MVNDNKILNSTTQGISLRFAHMNSVKSNEIKYNHFDGIYTYFRSKNNITQNCISHNQRYGMFISYNSTNNFIYQNEVIKNNDTGIYIIGTLPMNNTFWNNTFTENARHAFENGTLNFWDNGIIGNFWDNYTDLGSNAIDSNDDGIGDIPYILLGLESNQDNLPIFWDAPILDINTPINDSLYSFNAPQYSLIVEKGVAESIWYTYDNGVTNITLPSLTGFLQEACSSRFRLGALQSSGIFQVAEALSAIFKHKLPDKDLGKPDASYICTGIPCIRWGCNIFNKPPGTSHGDINSDNNAHAIHCRDVHIRFILSISHTEV
jgi:parallel beta-helix repeat protein